MSAETIDGEYGVIDAQDAAAKDDMRALHRATLSIFSDLSLDGVLRRITYAAKDLANATYAALGVPDADGGLETFIAVGMTGDEIKQIPHQPIGIGLIGEILRTGESIRIPEIADHPRASGFPEGHPPMDSFLGVPISAYGRPIGQICLTNKIDAPAFTMHDQRKIEMLAAHAAAAIENARLYRKVLESEAELIQRNEQLELINDLSSGLVSSIDLEDMLDSVLGRVIALFDAAWGEIFLLQEDDENFRRILPRGRNLHRYWTSDVFRLGEGFMGNVASLARIEKCAVGGVLPSGLSKEAMEAGTGTLVGVPLSTRNTVVGVLSLGFAGEREFSSREIGLLEAVGAGFGVGAENTRLTRKARRFAVLEERERIGMDLHDGVIQTIYAVGLTLDSTRVLIDRDTEAAQERLERSIVGLNNTIRDIRSYILDLQPTRFDDSDVEQSIERLGREFETNCSVNLDIRLEPDALLLLEQEKERAMLHIAQEALANVAKHSKATRAWLSVRQHDDQILLQVIDNGMGFDMEEAPRTLGHGLSNMAQRADSMGAEFEAISSPGEGTTITVRVRRPKAQADQ